MGSQPDFHTLDMLGIIDWGIGGVSIHKLILEKIGDVPTLYLSDTGATPYGKMSRPELIARLDLAIRFMESMGVTHLVIGCNAASTAIGHLDGRGLKIIGMIESGVAAAMKEKPERLGLIGGRRTVLSGAYRRTFAEKGVTIEQRIAQPLSGLIESGDTDSERLKAESRRILEPIKDCSHILLACTHYPAIRETLSLFVSKETTFVDPANELVDRIKRWKVSKGIDRIFLTTGDPVQMRAAAFKAFGFDIGDMAARIPVSLVT